MENLQPLFDALESNRNFSSEAAIEIDIKLSNVLVNEVPDHKTKSVMDYIDFRFLHKAVIPFIQIQLQALHDALSKRSRNA